MGVADSGDPGRVDGTVSEGYWLAGVVVIAAVGRRRDGVYPHPWFTGSSPGDIRGNRREAC